MPVDIAYVYPECFFDIRILSFLPVPSCPRLFFLGHLTVVLIVSLEHASKIVVSL